MNEETKHQLAYIFSLLRMTVMANKLSIATDPDGHILFFSTEEYMEKGEVSKCKDGCVFDIKDLVK